MGCCSGLLSWHVGVWHCVLGRFLVISSCASKMDQSGVLKIGSFPFVSIFYKFGELPLPVRIVFAKVLSLKSICNPLIWVFRAGLDRAPSCVYTSLWLSLTADGSSVEFGGRLNMSSESSLFLKKQFKMSFATNVSSSEIVQRRKGRHHSDTFHAL